MGVKENSKHGAKHGNQTMVFHSHNTLPLPLYQWKVFTKGKFEFLITIPFLTKLPFPIAVIPIISLNVDINANLENTNLQGYPLSLQQIISVFGCVCLPLIFSGSGSQSSFLLNQASVITAWVYPRCCSRVCLRRTVRSRQYPRLARERVGEAEGTEQLGQEMRAD